MRLSDLLDPGVTLARRRRARGRDQRAQRRFAHASSPGMLFAALAGSRTDGRRFVADAIARGAAAVLADPAFAAAGLGVPLVLDPDPRRRLALMAARFYGAQPRCIVAVTGTSGKTSVAGFVRQLWSRLGHQAASLGTLGLIAPGGRSRDRPDHARSGAPARAARRARRGRRRSSGARGLEPRARSAAPRRRAFPRRGVYQSLTRSLRLSRQPSRRYLAAKRRLFSELLPPEGTAVLNADQPEFATLAAVCRERGIAVLDYGARAERLRLVARRPRGRRPAARARARRPAAMRSRPRSSAPSRPTNLLAALGLVVAAGRGRRGRRRCCSGGSRVPPAGSSGSACIPSGAPVFVDYAHKPDALAQVLDGAAAARRRPPAGGVRLRRRPRSGQAAADGRDRRRARPIACSSPTTIRAARTRRRSAARSSRPARARSRSATGAPRSAPRSRELQRGRRAGGRRQGPRERPDRRRRACCRSTMRSRSRAALAELAGSAPLERAALDRGRARGGDRRPGAAAPGRSAGVSIDSRTIGAGRAVRRAARAAPRRPRLRRGGRWPEGAAALVDRLPAGVAGDARLVDGRGHAWRR